MLKEEPFPGLAKAGPGGIDALVRRAEAFGFSHAGALNASLLRLRTEVRDMCAADKCKKYGRSWMCPPACGSLAENAEKLRAYRWGIIVQTTAQLEDDFDIETMQEAARLQGERFLAFRAQLVSDYPSLLPLGSGGCFFCEACTYPGAPCRFPDKAMPSMEAFGLLVSDVCADNGIPYYYGPGTLTYTGCYLLG